MAVGGQSSSEKEAEHAELKSQLDESRRLQERTADLERVTCELAQSMRQVLQDTADLMAQRCVTADSLGSRLQGMREALETFMQQQSAQLVIDVQK
eukprot:4780984-Karenia_brevis.AAC.1